MSFAKDMRSGIGTVLLAALSLRAAIFLGAMWSHNWDISAFWDPDTRGYVALAKDIVENGTFQSGGIPEIRRTPGYPLFVGLGQLVGGLGFVTVVQIVLSVVTAYVIYRVGLELFRDKRAAQFAMVMYAFEPTSVRYSVMLLTETLFTFILVLFIAGFLAYLRTSSRAQVILSGVVVAFAAFVRPIAYYLPFFIAPVMFIFNVKKDGIRRASTEAVLFLLVAMVPMWMWQTRNALKTSVNEFSTIKYYNLYFYEAASLEARLQRRSLLDVQGEYGNRMAALHAGTPTQIQVMRDYATAVILEHPGQYAKLRLLGCLNTLLLPEAGTWFNLFGGSVGPAVGQTRVMSHGFFDAMRERITNTPLLFVASLLLTLLPAVIYLLAFVALVRLMRNHLDRKQVVFLLVLVFYFVSLSGAWSVGRFRHPIMPVACLLAGGGVSSLIDRWKARQGPAARGNFGN